MKEKAAGQNFNGRFPKLLRAIELMKTNSKPEPMEKLDEV
jgi:hypothetical protein